MTAGRGVVTGDRTSKTFDDSKIAVAARQGKWRQAMTGLKDHELTAIRKANANGLAKRYGINLDRANLIIADAINELAGRQRAKEAAILAARIAAF